MKNTQATAIDLSLDGCRTEVRRQAHDLGETISREEEFSRAHTLQTRRVGVLRARAVQLLRQQGQIPGARPTSRPAPKAKPATLADVVRREVDQRMKDDSLSIEDALSDVRDELNDLFATIAKEKGATAPEDDDEEIEADDEEAGGDDGAEMRGGVPCKDPPPSPAERGRAIGDRARAIQASAAKSGEAISWEDAFSRAHVETTSPKTTTPTKPIRSRSAARAANGGA